MLDLYIDVQNVTKRANPEGVTYNRDYSQRSYTTGQPVFPAIGVEYIPLPPANSCYDRAMKLAVVTALVLAACGGPRPKPESPIVNEGSDTPETCCCKSFPLTSDDGKPIYEMQPRMECSAKQGECVPDVQCRASQPSPPAN